MSDTIVTPPTLTFGSLHAGDLDSRGWDWSKVLSGDGVFADDTITTASVTLVRRDAKALVTGDLVIQGTPTISTDGLSVTIRLQAGTIIAAYKLTLQAVTTLGKDLFRDSYINVVPRMG